MNPLETLKPKQLDEVRSQVRSLLEKTDAFRELPAERRQKLAGDLVRVVGFLADPAAGQKELARGLDASGGKTQEPPPTAAHEGAEAMKEEMDAINFPQFVSSLIQGVFQSIVDASIRQMEAYQKLLENVVKSLSQYASDNITPNQARDYLANKYPEHLQVNTDGDKPKLEAKSDADPNAAPDFKKELGLTQQPDLSDEASEQMMIRAAQLQMAKMKQQQLSTMVLLGINRIVVTDGLINAKVVIDVKTKDVKERARQFGLTASSHDEYKRSDDGGWFSGSSSSAKGSHDVTISSAMQSTDTHDVETKAKLTGEVRVNFKSETFPLDKMAPPGQIADVTSKAKPG